MTLQRLNEHLNIVLQLHEAQEILDSLQSQILGATNYDGMPHAPGVSRKTETLAIILQQQIQDVNRLENIAERSEADIRSFISSIEDNQTKMIFNLRFLCGQEWKAVAAMLGGGNTEGSVKMMCYRYLGEKVVT